MFRYVTAILNLGIVQSLLCTDFLLLPVVTLSFREETAITSSQGVTSTLNSIDIVSISHRRIPRAFTTVSVTVIDEVGFDKMRIVNCMFLHSEKFDIKKCLRPGRTMTARRA